jgi:hypothetical protein
MELDTVYARNDGVISRRIVDELYLVHVRKNVADANYFCTLNDVAARIYELIDGTRPLRDIVGAMVDEFEVTPEVAEADIRELVTQLLEIEGIREVRGDETRPGREEET